MFLVSLSNETNLILNGKLEPPRWNKPERKEEHTVGGIYGVGNTPSNCIEGGEMYRAREEYVCGLYKDSGCRRSWEVSRSN